MSVIYVINEAMKSVLWKRNLDLCNMGHGQQKVGGIISNFKSWVRFSFGPSEDNRPLAKLK